jgi:hypothetical protein
MDLTVDGVVVAVGIAGAIFTPLFQIVFLPLFTHVYLKPLFVLTCPTFLHVSPALTAADAVERLSVSASEATTERTRIRFMTEILAKTENSV